MIIVEELRGLMMEKMMLKILGPKDNEKEDRQHSH